MASCPILFFSIDCYSQLHWYFAFVFASCYHRERGRSSLEELVGTLYFNERLRRFSKGITGMEGVAGCTLLFDQSRLPLESSCKEIYFYPFLVVKFVVKMKWWKHLSIDIICQSHIFGFFFFFFFIFKEKKIFSIVFHSKIRNGCGGDALVIFSYLTQSRVGFLACYGMLCVVVVYKLKNFRILPPPCRKKKKKKRRAMGWSITPARNLTSNQVD